MHVYLDLKCILVSLIQPSDGYRLGKPMCIPCMSSTLDLFLPFLHMHIYRYILGRFHTKLLYETISRLVVSSNS